MNKTLDEPSVALEVNLCKENGFKIPKFVQ